jgi:pseudouridine synthase
VKAAQRTQLHRALSKLGVCSRARAALLVRGGGVRVNGRVVRDPLAWVVPGSDRIDVEAPEGRRPPARTGVPVLLAMHKPPGYVTTRSDERGRATVYDLLPARYRDRWLFPVGRLDRDSEGLLLFTDDGALADRLTAPSSHVEKVYRVLLDRELGPAQLRAFREGVEVSGRRTLPARIEPEGAGWYRVTLVEGRNRQIRRMVEALGGRVRRLVRTAVGPVALGDLAPGRVRRCPPPRGA